ISGDTVVGRTDGEIAFVMSIECQQNIKVGLFQGHDGKRPLGWRFPEMNMRIPASLLSFTVNGDRVRMITTIEVLKPEGVDGDTALARLLRQGLALEGQGTSPSQPLSPQVINNTVGLTSEDARITHAVVKLYTGQKEHSRL